ncbi:MAG: Na+/H+ antiporter subunit E [Clostridia bacterium]|nr:Na+/H+ antiporter subunit E [Clostridia bacterium]
MIKRFVLMVSLLVFWFILYGEWSLKLLIYGLLISLSILFLTEKVVFKQTHLFTDIKIVLRFIWFFGVVVHGIIKASFLHLLKIIKNKSYYDVLVYKLSQKDDLINTLIANAITLTPGTVTISLEEDLITVACMIEEKKDLESIRKEISQYEMPFTRSLNA